MNGTSQGAHGCAVRLSQSCKAVHQYVRRNYFKLAQQSNATIPNYPQLRFCKAVPTIRRAMGTS
ncbi:MAG: hypothetical protein KJN61_01280, partial [Gammaproteobacteria bacterium]|nr:hypothetical protein [Gammaproteobacteria bacterium]